MKNKNLITTLLLVAIIMIIGVSYAFFSYTRESTKKNQLIAGQVYMHFNETGDSISLTNAFPETDSEARDKTNNYITFTIDGVNATKDRDIYYEILLMDGSTQTGKTRFKDKDLKFDLVETSNVGGVETTNTVLSGVSYDEINNTRIWVNTIPANTTSAVTITYRLRMWISDEVVISDTLDSADYKTSEYANSYASVKVAVNGDFEEKKL